MTATSKPRFASSRLHPVRARRCCRRARGARDSGRSCPAARLLHRRFPAGEREPRAQVFGVGRRRERARLQPEAVGGLRAPSAPHRRARSLRRGTVAPALRRTPAAAAAADLSDDRPSPGRRPRDRRARRRSGCTFGSSHAGEDLVEIEPRLVRVGLGRLGMRHPSRSRAHSRDKRRHRQRRIVLHQPVGDGRRHAEADDDADEDADQRSADARCGAAACAAATDAVIAVEAVMAWLTSRPARRCRACRARCAAPARVATTSASRAWRTRRRRPGSARHYSSCGIPAARSRR